MYHQNIQHLSPSHRTAAKEFEGCKTSEKADQSGLHNFGSNTTLRCIYNWVPIKVPFNLTRSIIRTILCDPSRADLEIKGGGGPSS